MIGTGTRGNKTMRSGSGQLRGSNVGSAKEYSRRETVTPELCMC
jgi:hypothetical protein